MKIKIKNPMQRANAVTGLNVNNLPRPFAEEESTRMPEQQDAARIKLCDPPILISEWRKNKRETVRVQLSQYKGNLTIECRLWYSSGRELMPGKSGITLGIKNLPVLAEAFSKALDEARTRGLLGDANH